MFETSKEIATKTVKTLLSFPLLYEVHTISFQTFFVCIFKIVVDS